jgi:hypothetical protein
MLFKYKQLRLNLLVLKGTLSRDFRPSVFFIKQSYLGPWVLRAKTVSYIASYSPRKKKYLNFGGVNDTAEILGLIVLAISVTPKRKIV